MKSLGVKFLKEDQMKYFLVSLLLATLLILGRPATGQVSPALSLKTRIALPDVKGRIDHFSVDVKGQRLFMAAVGNHTLEVMDLKSGKRVRTITDLAEPQGVFFDAATNRLYVACGLDGVTKIFDGTTFQLVGTVKFPDDADNIRYDARGKSVIVGYAGAKELRNRNEGTGGLGFIDSTTGKQTREIAIDAHPESFRLEEKGARLFVNVPDKKEIEVVDVAKGTILARWPVSAKNNFPMSLDEAHHRLFVGCWTPPRLIVFDTETGKEVAALELGEKGVVKPNIRGITDDLFYDSARSRIYVLNALGSIDVFQQKDPDHYDLIGSIPTPSDTKTGLFVPDWGKLFVAVVQQGNKSAEIQVYEAN
jgi:DNA-binding beta-propeller fold protein YncE